MTKMKRDTEAMARVNSPIIFGLENIAALFGRTPYTIAQWRETQGFPMARDPVGVWFTTISLIEDWCLARNAVDPYCGRGAFVMSPDEHPLHTQPRKSTETVRRARALAASMSDEQKALLLEDLREELDAA